MKLITADIKRSLLRNARTLQTDPDHKLTPVCKWFDPYGAATWLITDMDLSDNDIVRGLCDLGLGSPEFGCVRVSEVAAQKFMGKPRIERDLYWTAGTTIDGYMNDARKHGRIMA